MESGYPSLSTDEFIESVEPNQIRTLQIIIGALMMGVFTFLAVMLGIFTTSNPKLPPPQTAIQNLNLMSMINIFVAFSSLSMSFLLGKIMVNRTALTQNIQNIEKEKIYANARNLFQATFIVRSALLEGGAFFGIIVCFIGSTSGAIQANPKFWINLFPAILFLLLMGIAFPHKGRLKSWFEAKILPLFDKEQLHPSHQEF